MVKNTIGFFMAPLTVKKRTAENKGTFRKLCFGLGFNGEPEV